MNKKTILNRTLPLIIALAVILIVAVCITAFAGDKKVPQISSAKDVYLTVDLGQNAHGYEQKVDLSNKDIYDDMKFQKGLEVLVRKLDKQILTEKGYVAKVTEDLIKEEIEKAIFTNGYDSDEIEFDEAVKSIKTYIKNMYANYGIDIDESHIAISSGDLVISLAGEEALKDYYTVVVARELYAREKLGEDQVKAYEEYINAYEKYLEKLHKYNNDEIKTAPTEPTEGSKVTISSIKSDYEKEHADSYWTLFTTYATKEEAEKALLQVGVVIVSSTWYEYLGINPETNEPYASEYYKDKNNNVHALDRFEIIGKMIELFNNANSQKSLVEGSQYTVEYVTAEEFKAFDEAKQAKYSVHTVSQEKYDALDSTIKAKYTEVQKANEEDPTTYEAYRGYIFNTEVKNDSEGNVDKTNVLNDLYFTKEDLNKVDSSIFSYIKSLTATYANGSSWNKCYTTSIQSKGSYYVLAVKLLTVQVKTFEEEFGKLYNEEQFKADGTIGQIGYVSYTGEEKDRTFNYEGNPYWTLVNDMLDGLVSSTVINEYLGKLRVECGLTIFDEELEKAYTKAYTSDYKNTKKSNAKVVAKLSWKEDKVAKTFEVKADDLFTELNDAFGGMTAVDAYQYQYMLFQNEIIDYAKYLNGASLKDSVLVTEYALANKGSLDAITKWKKASSKGTVEFTGVASDGNYDVLVKTRTNKKDAAVKVDAELTAKAEDEKVVVTVSNEAEYQDSEALFEGLSDQISALKLYFSNGNFANYGYDANYGWKNFLKDYFNAYYGVTITNNDELKLYYIYENTATKAAEDLAKLNENDWNNVYLPAMQSIYDSFLSVDAIHFLISVNDSEGNISDPSATDTAWTNEQVDAAKELYGKVLEILKKTKKSSQATILNEIVDAFDDAPRFINGAGTTTAEQQAYIASLKDNSGNSLYVDNVYNESVIEYTATFKGIEVEVSKYKTLGLHVKYEDLGTVTQGKMVENFENALKTMWEIQNNTDAGMVSGTALETNLFYDDFASGEFLITEFGYHVLVANKFTGRTVDSKKSVVVGLPSYDNAVIYEADDERLDDFSTLEKAEIENYYTPVHNDFTSSAYYQLNAMANVIEKINNGVYVFATPAAKEQALRMAKYYHDSYYASMTYIKDDYTNASNLMKNTTNAINSFVNGYENVSKANLDIIVAATVSAINKVSLDTTVYTATEITDFNNLKAKFESAKAALLA